MKIAVVGTGYVALANAVLLAQHNEVVAPERVAMINRSEPTVEDTELEQFLKEKPLNLVATINREQAYKEADYIVIATPASYDRDANYVDTSTVEAVVADAGRINPEAMIVIKSTAPVGFTRQLREQSGKDNIIFSPEFLREDRALYDNIHPSRVVIGDTGDRGKRFAKRLAQGAED